MISFDFGELHVDGRPSKEPYDILLKVVATFSLRIGDASLFSEEEFPVVELAVDLRRWLKQGDESEFRFESLDYEQPLFWFKPEEGGWRVESAWQKGPVHRLVSLGELKSAATSYVDRLKMEVKEKLSIDVTPAFRLRG